MAGDWIKMRTDLFTHPKVVRISSALKADRFRTVGGLMSVWCLFDAHSTDGQLEGYSLATVDDLIGWEGFATAMQTVGWLEDCPGGLVLPEFDKHNGQSAKRRAQDSDRKRAGRLSASEADKNGTRGEERREESSSTTPNGVVVDSDPADDFTLGDAVQSKSKAARPECPHQEIIALYHEILPMCPSIRDWTPSRQQALRGRWNEDPKRQNLEYWRTFFTYVSQSKFLTGRAKTQEGRKPFLVSLDWIVKAENFTKIREERYHNEDAA